MAALEWQNLELKKKKTKDKDMKQQELLYMGRVQIDITILEDD